MITNRTNAYHYTWGEGCEGWVMLAKDDLLVIEERMPPGTSEHRHHHAKARQLFMVTEGEFTLEIGGAVHVLNAGDSIEVEPGQWHQALNRSEAAVLFVNVSSPSAHGDRINEA